MDPNSITICTVFPSLRPRDSLPRGRPCKRRSAARRVLPRGAAANRRKPQSPGEGKQTCLPSFQWRSLLWLGQTWDPEPQLAPSLPPASQSPGASDHPDILCALSGAFLLPQPFPGRPNQSLCIWGRKPSRPSGSLGTGHLRCPFPHRLRRGADPAGRLCTDLAHSKAGSPTF